MMAPLALSTNSQCRAERIDDDLDVRSQLSLEIFFFGVWFLWCAMEAVHHAKKSFCSGPAVKNLVKKKQFLEA